MTERRGRSSVVLGTVVALVLGMLKRHVAAAASMLVGTLLLLNGCDEGPGTPPAASQTVSDLSVVTNPTSTASEPTQIVAGKNASVQFWSNGSLSQAVYILADGEAKVRVQYDNRTGAPTTVINELSGDYLEIRENGPNRVDFWLYNSAGMYQGGFAVLDRSGEFYYGRITGVPLYSGKQIVGQVAYSNSSRTGSFALASDVNDGLDNVQKVPSDYLVFFQENGSAGTRNILPASSMTRALTLEKGLLSGGLAILGAGLLGAVVGPAVVPSLVLAGGAAVITSFFVGDIANSIRDNFADSENETVRSLANFAADHVADKDALSPLTWIRDTVHKLKQGGREFKTRVVNEWSSVSEWIASGHDVEPKRERWPASTDGPPDTGSALQGTFVSQGSQPQQVSGSIDEDGDFNVANDDGSLALNGSVDTTGEISGLFSDGTSSGTITSGSIEDVGSCSVNQGSGGQGTFSYSHFIGHGVGTVRFFYDAYFVPDAFTVTTGAGIKFTTRGLVSGGETVSISIDNEPIVFVNVSAPRSGTQWVYTLGCLE